MLDLWISPINTDFVSINLSWKLDFQAPLLIASSRRCAWNQLQLHWIVLRKQADGHWEERTDEELVLDCKILQFKVNFGRYFAQWFGPSFHSIVIMKLFPLFNNHVMNCNGARIFRFHPFNGLNFTWYRQNFKLPEQYTKYPFDTPSYNLLHRTKINFILYLGSNEVSTKIFHSG